MHFRAFARSKKKKREKKKSESIDIIAARLRTFRRILVAREAGKGKRGRRLARVRGVRRNFCLHYEPNCTFTRGRYRETMQDTRANMGAHLKWDIPMFLGIASTKDGRARAPIMSSTRRDISLSRVFEKPLSRLVIFPLLPRYFSPLLSFFFFFSSPSRTHAILSLIISTIYRSISGSR